MIGSNDGCTAAVCRCPTFAGNTTDHSCNLQLKIIKFKCHIDNGIKICALSLHYYGVYVTDVECSEQDIGSSGFFRRCKRSSHKNTWLFESDGS